MQTSAHDDISHASKSPPLQVEHLGVEVDGRVLLSAVNLVIERRESVAVVGPSGVGKTTLLNCILGSAPFSAGRIVVAGTELRGISGRDLAQLRARHIGMVFQAGELLGELSATENVALPAMIAGVSRGDAEVRATAILEAFGVSCAPTPADTLSGGERQRTALARALINAPTLILADEPTGSLDPMTRDVVANILFDIPRRWNCGLLIVTHDESIARRADRIVYLRGVNPVPVQRSLPAP